jgi:hypothetical protein
MADESGLNGIVDRPRFVDLRTPLLERITRHPLFGELHSVPGHTPERIGTFGWRRIKGAGDLVDIEATTRRVSGDDFRTVGTLCHVLPREYNGHNSETEENGAPLVIAPSCYYETSKDGDGNVTAEGIIATIDVEARLWNNNGALSDNFIIGTTNHPAGPLAIGTYLSDNTDLRRDFIMDGIANPGARLVLDFYLRLKETSGIGWVRGGFTGVQIFGIDSAVV